MDFEEPDMILVRANAAFMFEKYDIAADLLQKYIDQVPRDAIALLNYALTLGIQSQMTDSESERVELRLKAIALCKNYIEIKGGDYRCHCQLARSYFQIGEYSEAAGSYLAALYFKPNDSVALRELGSAFFYMKEFEKSEKYYRKSLEVDPDDGQTWHGLGCALLKTSTKQAAKEAFKRAIEINPENTKWQASYKNA